MTEENEVLHGIGTVHQQENIFRFLDEGHQLRKHCNNLDKVFAVLFRVRLLQQRSQQIENVLQDGRIHHANYLLVLGGRLTLIIRAIEGAWECLLQYFILLIRRLIVIAFYYFHDEWNERVNENVSAIVVLAPLLKQIQQLLTQVTLTVFILKDPEKVRRDLRCHLRDSLLVHLWKCLECLNRQVHHILVWGI